MRFASIVGARPQFIKVAAVSNELRQQHEERIIHTGQHYDYALSARFFKELDIPTPDYHLACGSGTHGRQTACMLAAIEEVLMQEHFDWVLVYGDTNSTLAGALSAAKLHVPIAHVEAGLRSFDRSMPEEVNRVVTDHLSVRLFCPTETAREHLRNEGITGGVEVVGDVMYDLFLQMYPKLQARSNSLLAELELAAQAYVLVTIHRNANTDSMQALQSIARALNAIDMPVIFPIHPRTSAALKNYDISLKKHIHLIEPVGYFDMLVLEQCAYRILTDSGGVQKEAFFLGVPCVTLRAETEWVETVQAGWNILAGIHWQDILKALDQPRPATPAKEYFGSGDAARRIVQSWHHA